MNSLKTGMDNVTLISGKLGFCVLDPFLTFFPDGNPAQGRRTVLTPGTFKSPGELISQIDDKVERINRSTLTPSISTSAI